MLPLLRRGGSRHWAQYLYTCRLQPAPLKHCPAATAPPIYRPLACARKMASMSDQPLGDWAKKYDERRHSAERDFRSDTVTLPTGAMFTAILENASALGDDVMNEDQPTKALEKYMCELTGMPYSLFVSSGTMGNQLALRSLLTQPPYSVLIGESNHVTVHEAGMASMFSQAQLKTMSYKLPARSYLTLEDIEPHFVPDDGEIHSAPTKIVSLENTWQGCIMPVAEVRRVSEWAHANGMKVHMDGARLWNACYSPSDASLSPEQAAEKAKRTLREYCALVDSVTMCFSKSLGAPVGSILCGTTPQFIAKAKHFRKAMGGGTRQIGILTSAARVAVDDVFLSGVHLVRANALAKQLHDKWLSLGGRSKPGLEQQTNMVWLDLPHSKVTDAEFTALLQEEGLAGNPGRIVTHYQVSDEAVEAMKRVFEKAIATGKKKGDDVTVNSQSFSYATATTANGGY